MIRTSKFILTLATFVVFALAAGSAQADPIVLTFEGLQNLEPVQNYYNGGTGGNGSGPGPNFGITFSGNALAIIDRDAGGNGNIGGEPSPDTIVFFLTGGGALTLNAPAGFDTGFSFFYSAINLPGVVRVYSGLDGTGDLLATLNLPLTPFNGAPDPTGLYSPFVPFGVTFSGIARSVDFGGTADQIGFDNITFGSATPGAPIPEPATMLLLGTGLAGVAAKVRKRRNARKDSEA